MISSLKIVKSFQRRRELQKISQAVRSEPNPRNYETLCERVLAARGADAALVIVERAQVIFPWSESLQTLAFRVRKIAAAREVAELEKAIASNPSPDLYGRLAEKQRQIGDEEEALRLCRECAVRFPDNENAYLVEGRLRCERLRRTGLVRDGLLAAEQLERAVVLNPDNMKARRLLSDLYFEVGALARARTHLRYLSANSAPDDRIVEMLREADACCVGGSPDENLAELLSSASVAGHFCQGDADRVALAVPDLGALAQTLEMMPGIEETTVVDLGGASAGEGPGGLDGIAFELTGLAQESLVEMDMGNLRYGELSGPWGQLSIFRFGNRVLAVRADPSVDALKLRERVLSVAVANASELEAEQIA